MMDIYTLWEESYTIGQIAEKMNESVDEVSSIIILLHDREES